MSLATKATSAKQRAAIAINIIKKNKSFNRNFDDCFEMNDGEEVMNCIIEKARKDEALARAIIRKKPFCEIKELTQAINECLSY